MKIRGKITKDGNWWAAECETLQADTQGKSRPEALEMMKDWVRTMVDDENFAVEVEFAERDEFVMTFADPARVLALIVERHRTSSGLTQKELADRIGAKSKSVIAQAEAGKSELGFSRLKELLGACGFGVEVRVVEAPRETASGKKYEAA